MINPLFRRTFTTGHPAISLNDLQRSALDRFHNKLANGTYKFEEISCLCGNRSAQLIACCDRYALPVKTYLCKLCGLMRTNPRMTEDSLAKFYEEDYRLIYTGSRRAHEDFFTEQVQCGKFIYDFIEPTIDPKENLTVFDVGCGAGGALIPFMEAGWNVAGCDLGDEYLMRGRAAGLVLEHGNPSVLIKHGRANLVILSMVLEHVPNPIRFLEEISQLLIDDGYLYIEVPGIFNLHRSHGDLLRYLQNAHLYHFVLATLNALMANAGFRFVKGDESINALFQKDKNLRFITKKNQYYKILVYLYLREIRNIFKQWRLLDRILMEVKKILHRKLIEVIRG